MKNSIFLLISLGALSCKSELHQVSVSEFNKFVEATNYITDAEKFEWSIVQKSIDKFEVIYGISSRCPNGLDTAVGNLPVTQVSNNDALAYAKNINARLPSCDEYWRLAENKSGIIN